MNNQQEFIMSPMSEMLQRASAAIACMKSGVEAYPVSEYILQSVFLKMTGSQEQKLKCICWELATEDYEYRYKRVLSGEVGECSNYGDKCKVYHDLAGAIKSLDDDFSLKDFRLGLSLGDSMSVIYDFYENTRHVGWLERAYRQFEGFGWSCMEGPCLCSISKNGIFGDCYGCKNYSACSMQSTGRTIQNLASVFNDAVYKHRNRCAHNILSQQRNKPPLLDLSERQDIDENYFVRFTLLLMIDEIIVRLYEKWRALTSC